MCRMKKIIASIMILLLTGIIIQPAAAWGELTHVVIVSKLQPNDPDKLWMKNDPKFAKAGALGPDIFLFSSNTLFSDWAHTWRTAKLPKEMKRIASTAQEKVYVDGWWSHFASDIIGHRDYVERQYPNYHTKAELGVDENLIREVNDYSFSVPYGLVRAAYGNVYGSTPTATQISVAVQSQSTAIFLERWAIAMGVYNTEKRTYTDFSTYYTNSITESEKAINNPPTQDINLNTGDPIGTASITSLPVSMTYSKNQDEELIKAANELLESGAVEVVVEDDKKSQVMHVKEPVIKNRKKFNQVLDNFIKVKKDKKS